MADARGDRLTIDLEKMMNSTNLTKSPQRCIFKVPNILSTHNPKNGADAQMRSLVAEGINTTEDMEILCKSGIVDNWLNIDDATKLFNQLYHDTFVQQYFYANLIEKVNEYCQHRWPKYRTVLIRDYFKHPWALVSVIAAAILLLLTFLQTLFTIIK